MIRFLSPSPSGLVNAVIFVACTVIPAAPADAQPLSIAVLDFAADRRDLAGASQQVTELLAAGLSATPDLLLVERARLDEVLSEIEFGLSGTVSPASAARVGHLIGAKALVTGRVFRSGDELVVVARVIGTETGRVYAESAARAADEPIGTLAAMVLDKISNRLRTAGVTLIGDAPEPDTVMADLADLVRGRTLPTVSISIPERHAGRIGSDPAAEIELALVLRSLGFRLVDPRSAVRADVQITGDALSDAGTRRGHLVSASGRVEIRAVDRATHAIVIADRQTEVGVDLSGEMAGKKALQRAAAALSARVVRALVAQR